MPTGALFSKFKVAAVWQENMKVANGGSKAKGRSYGEMRKAKKKRRLHTQKISQVNLGSPSSSPDTAMAKKYYQLSSGGQHSLKRLKSSARQVYSGQGQGPSSKTKGETKPSTSDPHAHTNGGAAPHLLTESSSEDSEFWTAFALSVLQNGVEGEGPTVAEPNGKGQEQPPYHAERDPVHNRTVLLMRQGQVGGVSSAWLSERSIACDFIQCQKMTHPHCYICDIHSITKGEESLVFAVSQPCLQRGVGRCGFTNPCQRSDCCSAEISVRSLVLKEQVAIQPASC